MPNLAPQPSTLGLVAQSAPTFVFPTTSAPLTAKRVDLHSTCIHFIIKNPSKIK
jgi:hypothetical protein